MRNRLSLPGRRLAAMLVALPALAACEDSSGPDPKARPLAGMWTDTTAGVEAIAELDSVAASATVIQGDLTLRRLADGATQGLRLNGDLLASAPDSLEVTLYNATPVSPDEPLLYGHGAGHYVPRSMTLTIAANGDARFDGLTFSLTKRQ